MKEGMRRDRWGLVHIYLTQVGEWNSPKSSYQDWKKGQKSFQGKGSPQKRHSTHREHTKDAPVIETQEVVHGARNSQCRIEGAGRWGSQICGSCSLQGWLYLSSVFLEQNDNYSQLYPTQHRQGKKESETRLRERSADYGGGKAKLVKKKIKGCMSPFFHLFGKIPAILTTACLLVLRWSRTYPAVFLTPTPLFPLHVKILLLVITIIIPNPMH